MDPLTTSQSPLPVRSRPPVPDLQEVFLQTETVDEEIWPVFEEEARDLIGQIEQMLRLLPQSRDLAGPSATLARLYHTLKGTARTLGLQRIGVVGHRLEVFFKELPQAGRQPSQAAITRLVVLSLEVLGVLMEQVREGETVGRTVGPLKAFQEELIRLEQFISQPGPEAS